VRALANVILARLPIFMYSPEYLEIESALPHHFDPTQKNRSDCDYEKRGTKE
jgi:hypothetical protein